MMIKKLAMIAFASGLAVPGSAVAGSMDRPVVTFSDEPVETFLSALKAGRGRQGVQALMSSPLWSKHPGFSEQMVGQIDAAVQAYGPVTGVEKLSSSQLGTMVVREYYLVQHRDMVTRWEFDLVRSGSGWSVGYFGFTDQPNSWFS